MGGRSKRKFGKGGSGDGGHSKRPRSHQPRRGYPGVLLTCDTGKERVCRQQGLEILQFYWEKAQQDILGGEHERKLSTGAVPNKKATETNVTEPDKSHDVEKGQMSLEEELSDLQQQAKRSPGRVGHGKHPRSLQRLPFEEYQTSCGGVVFLLYSPPASQVHSVSKMATKDQVGITASTNDDENCYSTDRVSQIEKVSKKSAAEQQSINDSIKSDEKNAQVDPARVEAEQRPEKINVEGIDEERVNNKQPVSSNENETSKKDQFPKTTYTSCPWDPTEAVANVVKDLMTANDKHLLEMPPTSRLITRMIPLQATCYPSEEEIASTIDRLMQDILVKEEGTSGVSKATKSESSTASSPPTFAIQFKRRFCEHLKRDQVIRVAASQVGQSTSARKGGAWKVDLKHPDYTFLVEVCQTLCGVSILTKEYLEENKNLQLAEIRTQANILATESTDDQLG